VNRARYFVLLLLGAVAALAVAGCGGSGSGSSSDAPATLVPASAPVYLQATLLPTGSTKTNTEGAISTITGDPNPGKKIVDLIDQGLKSSSSASGKTYDADIKPWLGGEAGIYVDSFNANGGDSPAALIAQTKDSGAAQNFIDDVNSGDHTKKSYKGVDYQLDSSGSAEGIVNDFLVSGDESAFKKVVDVSDGGSALSDNSQFKDAIGKAPDGSIADVYVNVEDFTKAVLDSLPANEQSIVENFAGSAQGQSALASVVPSGDKIEVDINSNGTQPPSGDASQLISSLPADSFVALGVPDLGQQIDQAINTFEQSGIPGLSPGAVEAQLQARGIDLKQITGLGSLGAFLQGTDPSNAGGAVTIETKDPKGAKKLLSNIATLANATGSAQLRKAPGGFAINTPQLGLVTIAVKGSRIVIANTSKAATGASGTAGGKTLGNTPGYQAATSALGSDHLSAYVDLQGLFALGLAAQGTAQDPSYLAAKPYLDHFTYLASGSGGSGDTATAKAIIGLQK